MAPKKTPANSGVKSSVKAVVKSPAKAVAKPPAKAVVKPAAKPPAKAAAKPASSAPAAGDASGQAALEALAGAMGALKPAELRTPRLDARAAATHVLGLLERRLPESLRKRFLALPAAEFSPETLTRARLSAQGVLHTQTRLKTAEASDPSQQISAVTLEEAAELRRRMLELCEYHFKGNTPLGREIADIRSGHGYQDLAEDLERLARIYESQAAIVRKDPVNYIASDAKDAVRLHARIRAELGDRGAETPAARDQSRRVWTLLERLYGDIVQTGRWLLRATPEEAEKLFPTLVQAVRKPTPVRKSAPQPAPAEPR